MLEKLYGAFKLDDNRVMEVTVDVTPEALENLARAKFRDLTRVYHLSYTNGVELTAEDHEEMKKLYEVHGFTNPVIEIKDTA